ncbi:hypothetical protein [Streptomyces albospinus]|nr:hypothetical protein [Streptomyces albospinus]
MLGTAITVLIAGVALSHGLILAGGLVLAGVAGQLVAPAPPTAPDRDHRP